MSDKFVTLENKAFIWQMLMEANAFIGIPDNYFDRIKNIYDNLFNEISKFNNLTLKEKNKLVLSKMVENINFFTSKIVKKPLEEVSIDIKNKFDSKKNEVMELVNHNKPSDISFNDDEDKPIDTDELNSKLNTLIASRNYDIKQETPDSPNIKFKKVSFNESENINKPEDINKSEVINTKILDMLDIVNKNQQLSIQNQDTILSQLKLINSLLNKNNI